MSWLTRSKLLAISPNSNYLTEVNLTSILQANPAKSFIRMPAQQRRNKPKLVQRAVNQLRSE
jgi:hypothetical protein